MTRRAFPGGREQGVPGDLAGGRYVSNIASLSVFDPTTVPEPESMAMLLAGLIGIRMVKRSRR